MASQIIQQRHRDVHLSLVQVDAGAESHGTSLSSPSSPSLYSFTADFCALRVRHYLCHVLASSSGVRVRARSYRSGVSRKVIDFFKRDSIFMHDSDCAAFFWFSASRAPSTRASDTAAVVSRQQYVLVVLPVRVSTEKSHDVILLLCCVFRTSRG